jgi:predicted AlkP superfamily pyrophosphatase or phosphodiesterase
MFRSVPPGKHGVGADNRHNLTAFTFPSILDVARKGENTALCSTVGKNCATSPRQAVWGQDNDTSVTRVAVDHLVSEQPDFAVLYMGAVDIAGPMHGWMSPEYPAVVEANDRAVLSVLQRW